MFCLSVPEGLHSVSRNAHRTECREALNTPDNVAALLTNQTLGLGLANPNPNPNP